LLILLPYPIPTISLLVCKYYISLTMRTILSCIILILLWSACNSSSDPLSQLINEDERLSSIANDPQYEVQIIYTQIDRDSINNPSFNTFSFKLDDSHYFYPASTVKLPASLIALEKMNRLGLPANARVEIDSVYSGQSAVKIDSSAANLQPSIAQYVKKILMVSDNDAHNRLYEFIGQDAFNDRLAEAGYPLSRMSHRLSISLSAEENARTNPMRFYVGDSLIFEQSEQVAVRDYHSEIPIKRGVGYQSNGEVINEPFDFSRKNAFPLREQHELIKALIFPQFFPERAFDLRPEDRNMVLKYMSLLPRNSEITAYQDMDHYWDAYVKFFMYGSVAGVTIPDHIKIFDKVGLAYGYAIDNAYIIDTEKGIEFLLSAVIHANPNQVFNDGIYGYESIAFPFLGRLGQLIYEMEVDRSRTFKPDFKDVIIP
jgi:hypothetical protein